MKDIENVPVVLKSTDMYVLVGNQDTLAIGIYDSKNNKLGGIELSRSELRDLIVRLKHHCVYTIHNSDDNIMKEGF
jgi:hypothetical protein